MTGRQRVCAVLPPRTAGDTPPPCVALVISRSRKISKTPRGSCSTREITTNPLPIADDESLIAGSTQTAVHNLAWIHLVHSSVVRAACTAAGNRAVRTDSVPIACVSHLLLESILGHLGLSSTVRHSSRRSSSIFRHGCE